MRELNKHNTIISTLTISLCVAGYSMVTSIFGEDLSKGSTQIVTIPFRFLCLLLSVFTIAKNLNNTRTVNWVVKITLAYLLLLLLRFGWDVLFGAGRGLNPSKEFQTLMYIVFLSFIPCIAVIKSYRIIDYELLFKLVYIMTFIAVIFSFFTNTAFQTATEERINANSALNTISSGHLGLTGIILSLIVVFKKGDNWIIKIAAYICILISFLVFLRSGSRGPILALAIIAIFYCFAKIKNKLKFVFTIGILCFVIYVFKDPIIAEIREISPILYNRFFERSSSMTSDRDPLFMYAWNAFLDSPLIGKCFFIYKPNGGVIYPHNLFLDSMMQLGLLGLFILVYICFYGFKYSYLSITHKSSLFWIGLLWIQNFSLSLVSGSISTQPIFWILLTLLCVNSGIMEKRFGLRSSPIVGQNHRVPEKKHRVPHAATGT